MKPIRYKLEQHRFDVLSNMDRKEEFREYRLWYTHLKQRPSLYVYDDYLKYERENV